MKLRFARLSIALLAMLSIGSASMAVAAEAFPTGETIHGKAAVEPAYDYVDGSLVYLLTPTNAPLPTKSNGRANAELFLVEYPPDTAFDVPFNCQGVPGNCPDHSGLVAGVATANQPEVYGTDPAAIPGHDHLVAPHGDSDFHVSWEVIEVLFTPKAVADGAITHLTTEAAVDAAVARGYAVKIDLGFALHGSIVNRAVYDAGTPVQ